jgi:hypothetical protein
MFFDDFEAFDMAFDMAFEEADNFEEYAGMVEDEQWIVETLKKYHAPIHPE